MSLEAEAEGDTDDKEPQYKTLSIGATTFWYVEEEIKKYVKDVNDGETYTIGLYKDGVNGPDYILSSGVGTHVGGEVDFRDLYGETRENMVRYESVHYTPVCIQAADASPVGHLFIDRVGNVAKDPAVLSCLYVYVRVLGLRLPETLEREATFFDEFSALQDEKLAKYQEMVKWGKVVRVVVDAVSVYFALQAGDVPGAVLSATGTPLLLLKLNTMKANAPRMEYSVDVTRKIKDAIDLGANWKIAIDLYVATGDLAKATKVLNTVDDVDDILRMARGIKWANAGNKFKGAVKQAKLSIPGLVATALDLIDNPDGLTEKALDWSLQSSTMSVFYDKSASTLREASNGLDSAQEAQDVLALALIGSLTSTMEAEQSADVHKELKDRKKGSLSGITRSGLQKLHVLKDYGDSDEENKAYVDLQAARAAAQHKSYKQAVRMVFSQTAWTRRRITEMDQ